MKYIKFFAVLAIALTLFSCGNAYVEAGASVNGAGSYLKDIGIIACGRRISPQKDLFGDGYTLYLPSFAEDITWSLTGSTEINGTEVKDGDPANIVLIADSIKAGDVSFKVMRSENLPALFIDTDREEMKKVDSSPYHSYGTDGEYSLVSSEGKTLDVGKLGKIRGRGNSTWHGPEKKPYQIELTEDKSLLGLAKAEKYVLLANYYDVSLLRNSTAFDLAEMSDGYSVSGEHIDLYICGEYRGTYLLCEKIEISENKINIRDLELLTEKALGQKPKIFDRAGETDGASAGSAKWYSLPLDVEDITGGYLLEVDYPDRYTEENSGFVTSRGLPIVISSPKYASSAQVEYIKEYVCDFEDALYSEDGYNGKGKHYSEYADVDSLVFRYLFEEFVLNIDGGVSSFYIYKDSDRNGGKLNFSVVWDFDCSFGNYDLYADLTSPDTLFVGESEQRNNGTMPSWFNAMLCHDEISQRANEYYAETFRAKAIAVLDSISSEYQYISASAEMDSYLYSGATLKDHYCTLSGDTPPEGAEYLYKFIQERIQFFDSVFQYIEKD
ncbi:MAG: CotH kinase family protein [Clostridia bacterium]|nr:CotH kinase family protein [Clostridia bacterium]